MRRPSPAASRSPARSKSWASADTHSRLLTWSFDLKPSGLGDRRQLPLEHLPGRIARQLIEEHHVARSLVARQVRFDVLLDRLLVQLGVVAQHDERLQTLTELLVGNSHDCGLLDVAVI